MRKAILFFAMMLAVSVSAQTQENEQKRKAPSKEEMAQKMTDRMVSKYGLSDKQKTKLLELNKEYADKMPRPHRGGGPRGGGNFKKNDSKTEGNTSATQQARPSKEEMDKKMEQMKENREAYNTKLKKIMTDEQYKKYTEDQQKQRQPRGPRGGNRQHKSSTE